MHSALSQPGAADKSVPYNHRMGAEENRTAMAGASPRPTGIEWVRAVRDGKPVPYGHRMGAQGNRTAMAAASGRPTGIEWVRRKIGLPWREQAPALRASNGCVRCGTGNPSPTGTEWVRREIGLPWRLLAPRPLGKRILRLRCLTAAMLRMTAAAEKMPTVICQLLFVDMSAGAGSIFLPMAKSI